MDQWLEKFCKDVFVDVVKSPYARKIVSRGVDALEAHQRSARDEPEHKKWYEQAIWYVSDNNVLDGGGSDEDKAVAVLEHLEKVNHMPPRV